MDAMEALKKRRAVRSYQDKEIDKKILEGIVDAGRLAPSADNIQPWEFVVVTKKQTLKRIANLCDYGSFIADAAACVVVFCKDTKHYLEDGSAATENVLLAATSFGIGSCWVAGDRKQYAEDIRKLLKAPEKLKLVSIVSLGYPAEEIEPRGKRSLPVVLHWEEF